MKRKWLFFGLTAIVASASGAACGGIDEPNFFTGNPGDTTTTVDSGKSTNDSGHVTSNDSGTTTTFDSGTTITPDAGVTPPPDPGIYCGTDPGTGDTVYCNGSDICCVSGEQQGSPSYACSSEGACTGGGISLDGPNLVIPCDDTQECSGGRKCCGTFVTGNGTTTASYYSSVKCSTTCNATEDRIFCDPANGNAECNGTDVCEASGALPGFMVCGQP